MSVLLTEAASPKCLTIAQSLGKKGIEITTSSDERFSPTFFSKYSKNHFIYPNPKNSPDDFANTILKQVRSKKIDVLMPVNSTETLIVSKNKDKFTPYTKVPFENFNKMMKLHDKNEVMKIAADLGIRVPETFRIDNLNDLQKISKTLEYPVVIKLRNASSSVGVSYAYSPDEFISKYKQTIRKFNIEQSNYPIVQEYIPGSGYGVSMLYNNGDIRASFTHKRLREYPITGGSSTMRISVRNPQMEKAAAKLLNFVGWHGLAMVEFKLDERTNQPFLLEVNPRFWGSIYQAIASGIDFPYLLYQMAVEGDVKPIFNYKIGVKTRSILPDLRSLMDHLRKSNHKYRILKEFCKFHEKDLYYDTLSIEDILPPILFLYEGAKEFVNSKYR